MKPLRMLLGALVAFIALASATVQAQMTIVVTDGIEAARPIAIIPFGWQGPTAQSPESLSTIISGDLSQSGQFAPFAVGSMPSRPTREEDIRWDDWVRLGVGHVVIGTVVQQGATGPGARYGVEFRLYDTLRRTRVAGERGEVKRVDLRKTAHQISDIIYEAITGERGAFDTRIAYVTEIADLSGSRQYAMNVADSDGFNAFPVLESRYPIMSPAWSNSGTKLAYVSFEGNRPGIYIQDLSTGTQKRVTRFPGINGAPAWSPDDSRLAMTLSKDGNPEIYVMHLGTGILRRVTRNLAIDTEPAWAPDGQSLVFTSDRGGRPQIYQVPVRGGRAERVSRTGKYNARARFTPDGTQIAVVHGDGSAYRIAMIELDTGETKVLTNSRLDESPTVSPNGRMVLYATSTGRRASLAAVSVDGAVRQRLAVSDGRVRDPAWSPYLKK